MDVYDEEILNFWKSLRPQDLLDAEALEKVKMNR